MGALPQIRAAVDQYVKGGDYFGPGGKNQLSGAPVLVKSNEASLNQGDAEKLWKESGRLTGVYFP